MCGGGSSWYVFDHHETVQSVQNRQSTDSTRGDRKPRVTEQIIEVESLMIRCVDTQLRELRQLGDKGEGCGRRPANSLAA